MCIHIPCHTCGGQRATLKGCFSPSTECSKLVRLVWQSLLPAQSSCWLDFRDLWKRLMGDIFMRGRELLCVKWRSVCILVYVQLVILYINCPFQGGRHMRSLLFSWHVFPLDSGTSFYPHCHLVAWVPSNLSVSPSCPRLIMDCIQGCPWDLLSFLSLGVTFMLGSLPVVIIGCWNSANKRYN